MKILTKEQVEFLDKLRDTMFDEQQEWWKRYNEITGNPPWTQEQYFSLLSTQPPDMPTPMYQGVNVEQHTEWNGTVQTTEINQQFVFDDMYLKVDIDSYRACTLEQWLKDHGLVMEEFI